MTKATSKARSTGKATTGMADSGELLTAGRLAAAWGVKPAEVKRAIAAAGVRPDATRCGCAYYGKASAASIQKHLA